MSFRLVPKSVNLNDLERRNRSILCVISPNSVALRTDYVKVVGDTCGKNVGQSIQFLVIYNVWRY